MAMFKNVARELLRLLYTLLLMGSVFRVLPENPCRANACGEDLHVRVVLAHHFLILAAFAAAVLLQSVRVAVSTAEAAYVAAARAKDFDAKHEAAEGVGCIAGKWRRASLRALLLAAVALSAAASFLAVVSIEDGYLYANGCDADHAGYGTGTPFSVVLTVGMTLLHGGAAWVAVCKN
jgi:hypothetical protein